MKLYYMKGACSLAPHIVLEELGLAYEIVQVRPDKAPDPAFLEANPMGAVPVLILDNGQPLTEVAAIVQYLADLKPELKLAPAPGTFERVRLYEWLNFISTEIHKGFGPLFTVAFTPAEAASQAFLDGLSKMSRDDLASKFDVLTKKLGSREWALPTGYSIADAYLFTILSWSRFLKVDLSKWPALTQYIDRVAIRPAVVRAMKAEHLIPV